MTDRPGPVPARRHLVTRKCPTPFGSMYVHVELGADGRPLGGAISDPRKAPEARVAALVEALSAGLDDCLRAAGGRSGGSG